MVDDVPFLIGSLRVQEYVCVCDRKREITHFVYWPGFQVGNPAQILQVCLEASGGEKSRLPK